MRSRSGLYNIIKSHWEQMVDNTHFYRGMSLKDLVLGSSIVLDPRKNPMEDLIPMFTEYSNFLLYLIDKGLDFYVNDFYNEPLKRILDWSIRDLNNPGIDFTTNYADAAAYAFNYAGSQIKHNFNLIVNNIYECEKQNCFNEVDKQKFRNLTGKIQIILKMENEIKHQPVVIKVKRSCQAFQSEVVQELNFGSYEFFLDRVITKNREKGPLSIEEMLLFLHQNSRTHYFNIKLINPLFKENIEEIIKL